MKPHALLISPYTFFPLDGGGKIRVYNNVRSLSEEYNLHILVPTPLLDRDIKGLEFLSKNYKIHTIDIGKSLLDWSPRVNSIYSIIRHIIAKYPILDIYKFYSNAYVKKLIKSDFAFIQIEHSWWYHPTLKSRRGKLIVIEHNYEYEYWSEMGKSLLRQRKFLEGLKYLAGSIKILEQEKEAIRDAELVLCVSERETKILQKKTNNMNIHTIISGIDISFYENYKAKPTDVDKEYIKLVYAGSLNTPQTAEGAIFFINQVWPILKGSSFNYKIYLVGRDPIEELKELTSNNKDIILTGFVKDVRPFIARADIYIVPLRYGSGIRLKIMEAMAMSKAIVSTKKGVEGLDLNNSGILLAEKPQDFARAIVKLAKDPNLRKEFGKVNLKYARDNFDWNKIFREKALPLYRRTLSYD